MVIKKLIFSNFLLEVLGDDSDLALNRQRVALLWNQTEAQLQATIQANLAFVQPLVQNRSKSYSSNGLTILADYTNWQIFFWNRAYNDLEVRVNQITDPEKRLEMLRAFAVNTESMRWDETERAKYPAITPVNINIPHCRLDYATNLEMRLNAELAELSVVLTLAIAQQVFLKDEYLAQLYTEVSYVLKILKRKIVVIIFFHSNSLVI